MFFIRKSIPSIGILLSLMLALGGIAPPQAAAITLREEEELSMKFLEMVRDRFELIEDPFVTEYVDNLGKRILASMPPQPFPYRFYVIKENAYNAFAAPAGHIFIHSGLIEAMEDESELAGILAHEIAHVVCRHISDKIERSSKISLGTLAGLAASIFLGAAGAGAAAKAVTVGSMAAGQSISLAYSREDERQADQLGLKYLEAAGYSAHGLLNILDKIRDKSWYGPDLIPTYLTTHPAVEERIAYIHGWVEDHPKPEGKTEEGKESDDFRKAHARLLALYGDPSIAVRRFRATVRKAPGDPMAHYGYGLALERAGHRETALEHLRTALEKKAFDPLILADLGRIHFADGRYKEAEKILTGAVGIDPRNPEALFYLGRTRLQMERYAEAGETLERLLEIEPDYPRALYFLGEAHGKSGDMAKAHYYLGLHHQEKREFKTATFHLKRALELSADAGKKEKISEILGRVGKKAEEAERKAREEESSRPPRRWSVPSMPDRSGRTSW